VEARRPDEKVLDGQEKTGVLCKLRELALRLVEVCRRRPELYSVRGQRLHEMHIYGVSFDLVGKQPIVLLKTAEGNKFLPIWIGHPEAAAILMKLQSQAPPRPMTHDLMSELLEQLEAQVVRITVTELRENTFYAQITVQQDGREIEIDSRPSDAIALAIRADAPIFAADRVIEESAIEFEGDDVDQEVLEAEVAKFKSFLDEVTAEDFAVESEDEEE
jgi:bifunctional DNase/RNase